MNTLLFVTMGLLSGCVVARADAPVASALTVPETAADASAVWAGVTGGKMTATQAWQDGLLDAATVQTGLAQGVASGQDDKAMQLRVDLGRLLVNNAPAVAALGAQLPGGVQLALADHYASIGDERAAPLYEAVIVGTKAPYEKALHLLALGKFWSQIGQPQKIEEVFGRGRAVLLAQGKNPHLAAEMLLMTARAWSKSGATANARQFYDKTVADGDSWMSGMALYGQANALMLQGKHEEARQVLNTPFEAQGYGRVKIALLSLQALSYLQTGELDEARRYAQQCLAQATALKLSPEDHLDGPVRRATQILASTQPKNQKPFTFEPGEVHIVIARFQATDKATQPLTRRLVMRAARPVSVTLTSDLAGVTVSMGDDWKPLPGSDQVEKEVILTVKPGALDEKTRQLQGTLNANSTETPDFREQVPVFIELR